MIHYKKKYSQLIWLVPVGMMFIVFSFNSSKSTLESEEIPREQFLDFLLDGNDRFTKKNPVHFGQNKMRTNNHNQGQHPGAAIISCADSRVSPELVFDQGLGDLFVIRNAGNIVGANEIGSVEFAIEYLGVPLVIILGHTNCGAIGAFVEHDHDHSHIYPENIQKIIDFIDAEEEEKALIRTSPNFFEKAVEANVLHGIHALKASIPSIDSLINNGKLRVVGAVYNMESGKVKILEE
ncbi:carbonic anhydrase [Aquiflexum sp. TKW24L]|uniref:carbonic anhydrase n=1 Tax=Aquiflexum sp. TKW24L TaxID=2942212 RepID=UPI0020C153D8|nr:carbonic anhydrase [Aquiflexum sp. TKW24L]MCL6258997.1 carbonic anhydrase [Aquiflexum sp. TKW24L]